MQTNLLTKPLAVMSLGIEGLEEGPLAQGVEVTRLDWCPVGDGSLDLAWTLARHFGDRDGGNDLGNRIDAANAEVIHRIVSSQPVWTDVIPHATEVWPDIGRTLLHAGPPIEWGDMCGPMRGAVIGAVLYEGWAQTPEEALKLVDRGEVKFSPCHEYDAVGPMCGVVSPSMPLLAVLNEEYGNVAYSPLSEGSSTKSLRFGAYNQDVIQHLQWVERILAPTLRTAVSRLKNGLGLKQIMAQALHMGDDMHNRTGAATLLFFAQVVQVLAEQGNLDQTALDVLNFIQLSDIFFLNFSMAACKATTDAAHGVPYSSVVTAIARNGVNVGIRVSGTGSKWFTGRADIPVGLYFPGFSEADANPDIGDSAITESAGLGAFAMAAAPAMVQFVGGTPRDALQYSQEMSLISVARHPGFTLPALDFIGSPLGIDIRKVLNEGIRPVINTAIGHKEPGGGMIGAGVVRVPMSCFVDALEALAQTTSRF